MRANYFSKKTPVKRKDRIKNQLYAALNDVINSGKHHNCVVNLLSYRYWETHRLLVNFKKNSNFTKERSHCQPLTQLIKVDMSNDGMQNK